MLLSSALTGTDELRSANIVDEPDAAPPVRQAYSLTMNSSSRLTLPSRMAPKSTSSVISLLMLAGYIVSFSFLPHSTSPVS